MSSLAQPSRPILANLSWPRVLSITRVSRTSRSDSADHSSSVLDPTTVGPEVTARSHFFVGRRTPSPIYRARPPRDHDKKLGLWVEPAAVSEWNRFLAELKSRGPSLGCISIRISHPWMSWLDAALQIEGKVSTTGGTDIKTWIRCQPPALRSTSSAEPTSLNPPLFKPSLLRHYPGLLRL